LAQTCGTPAIGADSLPSAAHQAQIAGTLGDQHALAIRQKRQVPMDAQGLR
jgi:hypothetical protein